MKTLVGGIDFSSSLLPSFFIAMIFAFSIANILEEKRDIFRVLQYITFPLFILFCANSVQQNVITKIERSHICSNESSNSWSLKLPFSKLSENKTIFGYEYRSGGSDQGTYRLTGLVDIGFTLSSDIKISTNTGKVFFNIMDNNTSETRILSIDPSDLH